MAKRKGKFEQPRQKDRDLSIPVYVERKNQPRVQDSIEENDDMTQTRITKAYQESSKKEEKIEQTAEIHVSEMKKAEHAQQQKEESCVIEQNEQNDMDRQLREDLSNITSPEQQSNTNEYKDPPDTWDPVDEYDAPKNRNTFSKIMLVCASIVMVVMALALVISNMPIKIDTSNIPTMVEYNQPMTILPKATCGIFPVKVVATNKVDTTKLGQQTVHYEADWLWKKNAVDVNVVVTDKVPPKIELNQNDKVLEYDEEYIEDGFKATDDYDGDLTDKVKPFYTNDKAYYFVADSSNNYAFTERDIVRKEADKTKPEIKLNGQDRMTIQIGDEYQEPGFTAIDNVDGDLTKVVSVNNRINTEEVGSYQVQYTVEDTMGNKGTTTRIVDVMPEVTNKGEGETIYLTFDDGPSGNTEHLLKVLAKYNIKASFFILGNTEYNDEIKGIVNGGHAIGVHWKNHSYDEAYASEKSYLDGLKYVQKKIKDLTGTTTKLIRFLGGTSNTISASYSDGIMSKLTKSVGENGFVYFDWNIDSGDSSGQEESSDAVIETVTDGIRNNPYKSSVVLQHDVKDFSVAAVEDIIIWGLSNGYSFDKLSTDGPTCQHQAQN